MPLKVTKVSIYLGVSVTRWGSEAWVKSKTGMEVIRTEACE